MGSQVHVSGMRAELRWGYHLAAALTDWSFDGTHFRATVETSDPFRLSQSPLVLVLLTDGRPDGERPITWYRVTGGVLVARLGPRGEYVAHSTA